MKTIDSTLLAHLTDQVIRPAYFVRLNLSAGSLRYWTGPYTASFNGEDWYGDGTLQSIGATKENDGNSPEGCDIILAGEPTAIISTILQDLRQGAEAKVYFALLDSSNVVMGADICFFGKLDKASLDDAGDRATVKLTFESHLDELNRTKAFRYTTGCQSIFYPGDLGFDYMAQMEKWDGLWGLKPKAPKKEADKKSNRPQKPSGKRN